MTVAYLLWRYPELSHTFIDREMAALEKEGAIVERLAWEARPGSAERGVTELPRGVGALYSVWAAMCCLLSSPVKTWRAVRWGLKVQRSKEVLKALWLGRHGLRAGWDVLHVHFLSEAAELAYIAHLATGLSYGLSVHARGLYCPRPLAADVLAGAAWVRAISEVGRRDLLSRFAKPSTVIRCAIRGDEGPSPMPAAPPWRLMSVARLVPKKGLDTAVKVAACLRAKGVEFQWDVIGGGPLRDGLQAAIDAAGLTERMHLMGPADEASISGMYNRGVNVFVFTGRVGEDGDQDGIPVAMLDAMARAVPVVTTVVGGIGEAVGEPPAVQCCPDDAQALAAAIEALLLNPHRARELGRAGAARVRLAFDGGEGARRLLTVAKGSKGTCPNP